MLGLNRMLLALLTLCMTVTCLSNTTSLLAEEVARATRESLTEKIQQLSQAREHLLAAGEELHAEDLGKRIDQLHVKLMKIEQERRGHHPGNREEVAELKHHFDDLRERHANLEERFIASRQEASELRESVAGLRHMVEELNQSLVQLRNEIAEERQARHREQMSKVDLSGRWELKLPAGSVNEFILKNLEGRQFEIKTGTVFAGIYQHQGDRLTIEVPRDERLTEFVWAIQDENSMRLIQSSHDTGADYTGATLKRMSRKSAKE